MTRPEQADTGEKVDAQAFLHEHLQRLPAVTVAEACRGMVMLADGEDKFTSFQERESSLIERKILRPEWRLEREQAIDRGSVAYMVTRILKIRGGVNMQTFGRLGIGDRRYAVRELAYLDLLPSTPAYRYMTGGELVDLLARADDYMAAHDMYPEQRTDITEMLATPTPAATRPGE